MEIIHVLNRGVDKRNIVLDDFDRLRFMQGLYLYNDANIIDRNQRRSPTHRRVSKPREKLVHIHAFCLMNNHYHLLLSPCNDDLAKLSAFMRKLNMGYAKYFNEKHERAGALWQGKYKSILINRDAHFLYIPYYIHLNPLDYKFNCWRNGNVKNVNDAIQYLQSYKWSSYLHYNQQSNYTSLIYDAELKPLLNSPELQHEEIQKIVSDPYLAALSETLEYK